MTRVSAPVSHGFAPVARADARVLILGTLPGQASLTAHEYYAQPRNAFWTIMGALFGATRDLPYPARLERLTHQRIALWDVCAAAHRPGSLDASIDLATLRPNRFDTFYEAHRRIERVCLNGQTAAKLYARYVWPLLDARARALPLCVLPSTSPAHASVPLARKHAAWAAALGDGA